MADMVSRLRISKNVRGIAAGGRRALTRSVGVGCEALQLMTESAVDRRLRT